MRTMLACALAVLIPCSLSADDKKDEKIDAKKLIGKWKPKDDKKGDDPAIIEFTKDGKVVVTSTADAKFKLEGTYKVDGKKILMTLKKEAETLTVVKLTDTELIVIDKTGKEDPLIRIKGK